MSEKISSTKSKIRRNYPLSPDRLRFTEQSRLDTFKHKRNVRRFFYVFFVAVIIILLITGIVFLLRIPSLLINNISVDGTHVIIPEDVKVNTAEFISGDFFGLIPKSNMLIYQKNKLETHLRIIFPRIKNIDIERINHHTLVIHIIERDSMYLWCTTDFNKLDILTNDDCYYIDDSGLLFAKAPYFSGNIYFKFYTPIVDDSIGSISPVGRYALANNIFINIVGFLNDLKSLGLKPTQLQTEPDGALSFILEVDGSSMSPKIMFKNGDDLKVIFNNFSTALKKEPLYSAMENGFKEVNYIDLRYSKKVYFKLNK